MESSAKIDVNTSTSAIYGYEVMIAFGAGSFVQASFAVIQTIVTPAEMSYGITFMLIGTFIVASSAASESMASLPYSLILSVSISPIERSDPRSFSGWCCILESGSKRPHNPVTPCAPSASPATRLWDE